ncbi:branched-chain amino acid ABC transporter permease [Pseudalkalibacillus hwajinpoensis]|uniref:Branched-chain amino acid ABC transporter permease n=1 Tax=Guptibacillus hwajinpoensis TaxID=208199 RepID=A0A4U1ML05_9BACL|nr:branched-chain amino acid ABC transporter permease [Pseudalkalibacillus hwajinpoensis]TKD71296.1 branched-chain amino acid ABC transporter permease [Pseudalkalibacillus hwajinpoensis]
MSNLLSKRTMIMVLSCVAILFPLVFQNMYLLQLLTLVFIWSIAVYGFNIISGYVGYLSLAHAGFFAIGAYGVGLLTTKAGLPYWLSLFLAVVITALAGALVGVIALRTKSHFFAIYTMCVGVIIYLLIDKWDSLTGGVRGLIGISAPGNIGPITFDTLTSQYYLALSFLALTIFICYRIVHSLLGRTFIAIRNSEELAKTIGISIMKNQLLAFTLSALFAGLSGALYASFIRFIGPQISAITVTFEMLMYLLVGGIGTLAGPLVGTLIVISLTQSLQFLEEYRMLIFGPVVVLLVLYYPRGITGSIETFIQKRKQQKISLRKEEHEVKRDVEEAG